MKFSRSATFFIGFMSVGLLAVATALPAEKRQLSSILSILTTLLGLLTPILSILSGLGLGSLTSLTSLTPVLGEVTSVLDTATSTLSLLNALGGILVKRDATEDAEPFVQVITNLATTLDPLTENPNLSSMLSAIVPTDTSLFNLLEQAEIASNGVLPAIAQGLSPEVISTLETLSFTQSLGELGLN